MVIDKWQPLSFSINRGIANLNKNKPSYMAFLFPFYGIDYHVFLALTHLVLLLEDRQWLRLYFCLLLASSFFFSNFNNTFCAFLLHVFSENRLYTPVLFPFLWLTVRPLAPKALVHTPQTLKRQLGLKGQMVWQSHLDLLERSHCMEKAKSETSQASSYPWAWPGGAGLGETGQGL